MNELTNNSKWLYPYLHVHTVAVIIQRWWENALTVFSTGWNQTQAAAPWIWIINELYTAFIPTDYWVFSPSELAGCKAGSPTQISIFLQPPQLHHYRTIVAFAHTAIFPVCQCIYVYTVHTKLQKSSRRCVMFPTRGFPASLDCLIIWASTNFKFFTHPLIGQKHGQL